MKQAIDEITVAVDLLMKLAAKFERGHCIGWSNIESIAGPRGESRGKHIIHKWRRRLERESEIVTLCADSVGVRLLTHRETATEIPRLRQRRAYRQLRRAIKQVGLIDVGQLSDHEKRLLAAQKQNMADARRELFRSQKQAREQVTATETNPRRKLAAT